MPKSQYDDEDEEEYEEDDSEYDDSRTGTPYTESELDDDEPKKETHQNTKQTITTIKELVNECVKF
jgi:hypothetical protein